MRSFLKLSVFSIFCGLLLASSAVLAQTDADRGVEVEFPEIEGWEKGEITTYPTAQLGYSIVYQSAEGGTVTIYVYGGGVSKIADGIDDKNVKNEIKKAKNDIVLIGERGIYKNVKEIKDDTVTLGGRDGKVKALYSLFNFEIQGRQVDSEIYLFGYHNNFIKIRATRAKSKNNEPNEAITTLLAEIDKLFSE
ncbi:MAG: hypothetical protein R2747_24395 [Pyrinomonadaceae bacterium]